MKLVRILLFNFITKRYLKGSTRAAQFSRRGGSVIVDFFYVGSLFILPIFSIVIPLVIINLFTRFLEQQPDDGFNPYGLIFFAIMIFIMLNKDMFRGKSVGKRICGYQIVDFKNGNVAHPAKCVLRNITCFIWPLEAIMILLNPGRRLGDYIAGTMLIETAPEEAETILTDIQNPDSYIELRTTLSVGISLTLLLVGLSLLPMLLTWYYHQ